MLFAFRDRSPAPHRSHRFHRDRRTRAAAAIFAWSVSCGGASSIGGPSEGGSTGWPDADIPEDDASDGGHPSADASEGDASDGETIDREGGDGSLGCDDVGASF